MEAKDKKRWNQILLEILHYFITICEENNLTYYIYYGSAIGAARHHGMIPWDDDIDVCMPRPDYERFLQICAEKDMGKYELITPQNTPNYYTSFAKLCDKTTTIYERTCYRFVLGMYIDIFVIDGMINNPQEIEKTGKKYSHYCRMLELSNSYYSLLDLYHKYIKNRRLRIVVQYYMYSLNRGKYSKLAIQKLDVLAKKYDYEEAEYSVVYPRIYGNRDICPQKWLKGKTLLPFESLQVALPMDYKSLLNHIYGDFTQLPPEDQRQYQHSIVYYNLEVRESLEDVLRKVRKR